MLVLLSRQPFSSTACTSSSERVRVFEDALSTTLIEQLSTEIEVVFPSEGRKVRSFWIPINGSIYPANQPLAMGKAVAVLHDLAYPGGSHNSGIVGAEFWAQSRPAGAFIDPHFDKDEFLLRSEGLMRMPCLSTVTYLSALGGPTVIFNQTATADKLVSPAAPDEAYFVWPRRSRHAVFQGDMYHAVRGDLAVTGGHRVTFLINWWARDLTEGDQRAVRLNEDVLGDLHQQCYARPPPPRESDAAADTLPAALLRQLEVPTYNLDGGGTDIVAESSWLTTALFVPRGTTGQRSFHALVPPMPPSGAHLAAAS